MYYCYVWGHKIKHLWDEMFFQHDFMMFSLKKDKSSPWHHLFEITCYLVPESLPWEDKHKIVLAAKSLQSCPALCDPIDSSPAGSPVPGILQARTLEWVAISFSNAWKWKVKWLSCVRLLVTPWTAAHQAPPSMGFSRQECWNGVPYI